MKKIITQIEAEFQAGRHSPYFPVSVYETPLLLNVFNRLVVISVFITLISNYSIAIIADSASSSYVFETLNDLLRNVDRIDQRFIELQNYDGKSGYQYLAILLTSFAFGIVGGVFQVLAYIRWVIIPKHAVKCDVRAAWGLSFAMLFCFAMLWVAFFDQIEIAGVQYIGMSRIFAWPIFPAIASLSSFVISFALWMAVSTAVKLIFNSGAERDRRD